MPEAYLYVLDGGTGKWTINDVLPSEEAAKIKGRLLWQAGAAGIRIDAVRTVVQEIRKRD